MERRLAKPKQGINISKDIKDVITKEDKMARDVTTGSNKVSIGIQPARIDGRESIWNSNSLSNLLRKAKDEARWSIGNLTIGTLDRFALPPVLHSHGWDGFGYLMMAFGSVQATSTLEMLVMANKLDKEIKQKKPEEIALEKYGYGRSSEHVKNAVVYGALSGASFYYMMNPGADKGLEWMGLGLGLGIAVITALEIRDVFKSLRKEKDEVASIALRHSLEAAKETGQPSQNKA
jgi:hypothetical protein